MANKVQLDAIRIRNYFGRKTPAWVGALPTSSFTNLDGDFVGGGNIRSADRDWVVKEAVTSEGGGVYISDTFTGDNALSATRWAGTDDLGVYWNFYLLDANLSVIKVLYENIPISDSLTSTTIEAAYELSQTSSPPATHDHYNSDQIDRMFEDVGLAPDGTTLVKGKFYGDTVGGDTVVNTNNPIFLAIQQTKFVAGYTSLSAAVTAIGSVTKTKLVYSDSTPVTSNLTVPANISLVRDGNGSFAISSGVTLTIANGFGFQAPPEQIFTGDGSVSFSSSLPEFYLEWFGATGDGATDDLAAYNKFIVCFPPTKTAVLKFGAKTYYFSAELNVIAPVIMKSHSETGGAAVLKFAANKSGIVAHHVDTVTGSNNGQTAEGSIFRNLHVMLNMGVETVTSTHTVTVNGLTVTRTAGSNFTVAAGINQANTININGYNYVIDTRDSNNALTLQTPRFMVTGTNGSDELTSLFYLPITGEWDGKDIDIDDVTYTIDTVTFSSGLYRITLTGNFSSANGDYEAALSGLVNTAGLAARPNVFHGFDIKTHATVEGCRISYAAGNALNFDNTASLGNANTNYALVKRNITYQCAGNGILTRGTNANQILLENNDFSYNHGFGIAELGFLGNRYIGNHTSFNRSGATFCDAASLNDSTFIGEYSEAGQPASTFGQNNLILGGTNGAGFSSTNAGGYLHTESGKINATNLLVSKIVDSLNTKSWMLGVGTSNLANSILQLGAGEEDANDFGGTPALAEYGAFQFFYNRIGTGLYSFHYKTDTLDTDGTILFYFTGSKAADGGGKIYFPNGFTYSPRLQSVASAATVTPNADTDDQINITAQAAGLTLAAPTGTPRHGQALTIRLKDNGTSRAIAYNAIYRGVGFALPAATTVNKTIYYEMKYNSTDSKWDVTDVKVLDQNFGSLAYLSAISAGDISNTPTGSIAATTVQAAIDELASEKQPLDAELTALAGLTSAANKGIQFTGAGTAGTYDLTAAGKALLDDADAAAQLVTLGVNATAAEVNQLNDVSAYQESVTAAGALSVTKVYSGLALVGAGAVTLAAPSATMLGQQKTIEMTADNGDVTLALTNCEGQSSGTTATFNDVGDKLILIAGASKWTIIKEFGVTLS